MAIDCEMTPRQRKLKDDARQFTRDLFVDGDPFGFKKSLEGFGVDTEMR
jgi:hypothetical protein